MYRVTDSSPPGSRCADDDYGLITPTRPVHLVIGSVWEVSDVGNHEPPSDGPGQRFGHNWPRDNCEALVAERS